MTSPDLAELGGLELFRWMTDEGAPDRPSIGRLLGMRFDELEHGCVVLREQEQAVAGALAVPRDVPLVVVEGNYLLLDEGPFAAVRALLTESWYLELDAETRVQRLVERHVRHGRTPTEARSWVDDTDEPNARIIERTRCRADLVVLLQSDGGAA